MTHLLPDVSILIPTLNESGFISNCVESLLTGDYPSNKIEVLVIDGGSEDDTLNEIRSLCRLHPNVKFAQNPKKIVPAAMNIGAAMASTEIIIWCGAHAVYHREYIRKSVEILIGSDPVSSVGGVITPIAKTTTGQAIAVATRSKFGVGNALYRQATSRQIVDTVFGGCFYKSSVVKIGGFNESWVRNQDFEFNLRLRRIVGPIILDPSIRCQYYCRESISALGKQYFAYGFWRLKTLIKYPNSFSYKIMAPVVLCVGLSMSFVCLLAGLSIGFALPVLYIATAVVNSLYLAVKHQRAHLALYLPPIFFTLHISWGLGFISSALTCVYNRFFKSK